MSEQVSERAETNTDPSEQIERLVRYGERLATGMLPVIEPLPGHSLPEPILRRSSSWQEHQLSMPLTGMLVGKLDVNLLEGNGVTQLFLNLHYIFPRTYIVASRTQPKLVPIRITGRSFYIDNQHKVGAVAYVREVFEDDGEGPVPLWALQALSRYREKPWLVVRCRRAADAVGAFQRELSRGAVGGIQRVYQEVATEYGFIGYQQFSWRQSTATAT